MSALDDAKHMQTAAKKDMLALSAMLDGEVSATEIFGFHAQQAVETSLEAWMSPIAGA